MSEHRVGEVEVPDVVQVEHEFRVTRQLNNQQRTTVTEQVTFWLKAGVVGPKIDVPCKARVIAYGRDFGVREICCTGSGPGTFYVKWRS